MTTGLKRSTAVAGVLLAAASAAQAAAPADTGGSGVLEEVIVTAQKRSENEQSVPMSMTTFSSAALEQKSINDFFDYATKVPNLAFAPTGDGVGTARTVSIRGISGQNVTGFYIDDVPLPDSVDPRVLDIDHIEVLRGPQGTLYGARSMGGTVRLITKTPDLTTTSGEIHAGVSDTDHTDRPNYTVDGVLNTPLGADWIALRLTGFYDYQAGYFKRSYCTDPATAGVTCFPLSTSGRTTVGNVADLGTYGGSASVTIKLTDDLTITPRAMLQRAEYNGFPLGDFNSLPGNGIGFPVPSGPYTLPQPLNTNDFTQARFFNIPEGGYDAWGLYSLTVHWKTGVGDFTSSTAYFDRKVDEHEDQSEFIWAAITSGLGGLPQPGPIEEIKDYQRFVEEARFASSLPGPVQFVVGGFFSDFHGRVPFASLYPPVRGAGSRRPHHRGPAQQPRRLPEPGVRAGLPHRREGAGDVRRGLLGHHPGLQGHRGPALVPGEDHLVRLRGGTGGRRRQDREPRGHRQRDRHQPEVRARLPLRPGQDGVRARLQGLPPGRRGADRAARHAGHAQRLRRGAGAGESQPDARRHAQLPLRLAVELRARRQDRLARPPPDAERGRRSDIKWKNIQQAVLLQCGFQFIANAGAAESKGGELELRAAATEHLSLSLGVGYQDAKITEAGESGQAVGSPVFDVPNWTGNGSVSYTQPVTSGWNFVGEVDYSYVGSSFSSSNSSPVPRERPAYHLLDARLGFSNGSTEIALVGKNLTNEVTNLGDNRSIAAEVPGRPRLFLNQPLTIGIEARKSF